VTKNPPSVGCHESWRNDLITPVSFIIGAIRISHFYRKKLARPVRPPYD
jgi:hypothetical protein